MQRLEEKVILIVGGTTGLGLSAAIACEREGAHVVVVGRSAKSVESAGKTLGERCHAMPGDAGDPTTATSAVAAAVQRFGRLDAAYHVAGGSGRRMGDGPLDQITDEGWAYTIHQNLTTVMNTNRAAVRQFIAQHSGGAILNMGSVLGFSPSRQFFATHTYAATKAAIIGLTKSCAAYYAPQSIRFNVIAPALVETPMAKRAAEDETILKFITTKQPLDGGRIGVPEDLDDAVVYLLSDGSKFVTGQVLAVDGGWCVSEGQIP